jgi:hypothetical protein
MTETTGRSALRVGLLARGDRQSNAPSARAAAMMAPLIEAFGTQGASAEHVIYADDAVDAVREQLLRLNGVLVWVNPIQDGATRLHLDALLRDVARAGVWVSAHPDVILKMGTKEVLYQTRAMGWGTDADVYRSVQELTERFPARLGRDGRRVLKQGRGMGGNGVWRVDLADPPSARDAVPDPETPVRVQHAQARDGAVEQLRLGDFLARCGEYFAWSGCLVDQAYQNRLGEGMVRCYVTHDTVVGFCHQWPQALLDAERSGEGEGTASVRRSVMEGPDTPAYRSLRTKMEAWVPQMQDLLGIETHALPVIWDADFLYGPKSAAGEDTYVLCEINISAVWPFPPTAVEPMVRATVERIHEWRRGSTG